MEVPFVPQQECKWRDQAWRDQAGPGQFGRCKFTRELLLPPDLSTSSFVPSFLSTFNTGLCTCFLCLCQLFVRQCYTCVDVEASFIAVIVVTSIGPSLTILHHICQLYCPCILFAGHLILKDHAAKNHTPRARKVQN